METTNHFVTVDEMASAQQSVSASLGFGVVL
jgi:hypothetical protein